MQDVNRNHIKIQKAKKDDAIAIIEYVRTVADETDFLTFDSSEFNKTVEEEQQIIEEHNSTKNKLFIIAKLDNNCLLYTSPSPRDATLSRMPSSA